MLSRLLASFKIYLARRILERRLRNEGGIVELVVVPKKLVLTSIRPGSETTGTVIRRDVNTGEEQIQEVRIRSSTWDGKAHFPLWGGSLDVSLSASDTRPTSAQLDVLKAILSFPRSIRADVERAVFLHYCQAVLPHHPTDESGQSLPSITSSDEIGKVVFTPPTLHPSNPIQWEDAQPQFTLSFSCRWNYYSVDVDIEEWKVVRVS